MPAASIKFRPPRISDQSVSRERLITELLAHDYRLVICQAPAGYGKTTAMAEYYQRLVDTGHEVAWLSLEPSDNDMVRFLDQARKCMQASIGQHADGDHSFSDNDPLDLFTETMADDKAPRYIFLDDFEVIHDASILETISTRLKIMPAPRQLIVLSRHMPQLSYSSLSINGKVKILGPEDFRFDDNEGREFFSQQNLSFDSEANREALIEKLNGWPTAFQISALELRQGQEPSNILGQAGHGDLLTQYVVENILEPLPEEQKEFLFKSCILNQLNAADCDAILQTDNSAPILGQLHRDGMFMQLLNDNPPLYRYHNWFSRILYQHQAKSRPDALQALHARASQYFIAQGRERETIDHALKAGDTKTAARLIENHALEAVYRSEFNTVNLWSKKLSETELNSSPKLLLACAWSHNVNQNFTTAKDYLDKLDDYKQQHGLDEDLNRMLPTIRAFYHLHLDEYDRLEVITKSHLKHLPEDAEYDRAACANCLCIAYIAQNKLESARQILLAGQSTSPAINSYFPLACNYALNGLIHLIQGEFGNAMEKCKQAQRCAKELSTSDAIARAFPVPPLSLALYELGQIDEAQALLERYISIIRGNHINDLILMSYLTLSRCYLANQQTNTAWQTLEELERIGYNNASPRMVFVAQKEMMRFYQLQGDLDKADMIRQSIDVDVDEHTESQPAISYFPAEIEARDITDIRHDLLQRNLGPARQRLETAVKNTHKLRRYRLWKLAILEALLLQAEQRHGEATKVLLNLFRNRDARQLRRSLIDEGAPMNALLKQILPKTGDADLKQTLTELVAGFKDTNTREATAEVQPLVEPLTRRELALLHLAADGLSNRAIAEQVHISEGTVKWHLTNIYAKLAVKRRMQAIVAARQLGLIS